MLKAALSGTGEGGIGSIITGLAWSWVPKINGGRLGASPSRPTAGVFGVEYREGEGGIGSVFCRSMSASSMGLIISDCGMTSSDI
jgi:hypothetical protein